MAHKHADRAGAWHRYAHRTAAVGTSPEENDLQIGTSVYLIVAGMVDRAGYPIRFLKFLTYGLPLMLLSIAISSLYIHLRYF